VASGLPARIGAVVPGEGRSMRPVLGPRSDGGIVGVLDEAWDWVRGGAGAGGWGWGDGLRADDGRVGLGLGAGGRGWGSEFRAGTVVLCIAGGRGAVFLPTKHGFYLTYDNRLDDGLVLLA
jgi:hypothetical protein